VKLAGNELCIIKMALLMVAFRVCVFNLFLIYIGLLHDVGHGPFSHMFEREFLRQIPHGIKW
jgi:hypothetical protein